MLSVIMLTAVALFAYFPTAYCQYFNTVDIPTCQHSESSSDNYLYFKDPDAPNHVLSIATRWEHYAKVLQTIIPTHGFTLVPEPNQDDPTMFCHWKHLETVRKGEVYRGKITYKDCTRRTCDKADVTLQKRSDHGISDTYTPPPDKTLHMIKRMLENDMRARDSKPNAAVIGVLTGGTLGLVVLYMLSVYLINEHQREDMEETEMVDLEATFNPPDIQYPEPTMTKHDGLSLLGKGREFGALQAYDVASIRSGDVIPVSICSS